MPYLVETIVYCLSEKNLYVIGDEIMKKIYQTISKDMIRKIFENELINSNKLYIVYIEWLEKYIKENTLNKTPSSANISLK